MKIGIISDTHNNIEMTRKAVELFKSRKVDIVIHVGDFTRPEMIDLFDGLLCRFVLGNCDMDVEKINEKAQHMGFGNVKESCDIKIDNKRFFVMHGNDAIRIKKAIASGDYDYVIKGHTHSFENYISNNTRIINPGAINDAKEHSMAILETKDDSVEKITI
ncbi:MAG: YfcE family phosphodiesterase [Spirochaetota bacterium]|nr:YfcE family phosphodiesterase [Spirochaetota bacterium]